MNQLLLFCFVINVLGHCNAAQEVAGQLAECTGLQAPSPNEETVEERARLYWLARRRMAELPATGVR